LTRPENLMSPHDTVNLDSVKAVVVEVLGLEDRADELDANTPLLGSLPELDSMAVAELIVELERRFDIVLDDGDITAEVFETFSSLTAFVEDKTR
jgi:acyl carrier protein